MKKNLLLLTTLSFLTLTVCAHNTPIIQTNNKKALKVISFFQDNTKTGTKNKVNYNRNTTRTNQEIVYVVDSLHTDYPDGAYERTYYTHDEKGNNLLTNAKWWDENGNIEGGAKYEYEYDDRGNRTVYISSSWNHMLDDFSPTYKEVKTYDGNNNIISETVYTYDSNVNLWIGSRNDVFTFNSQNQPLTKISTRWDTENKVWVNTTKNEYTYTEDGLKETANITAYWNESLQDWENSSRVRNEYENSENPVKSIHGIWIGEDWLDALIYEYGYDEQGSMTSSKEYMYDDFTDEWENGGQYKYEYTYDNNQNMLSEISARLINSQTNEWRNITKYEFDYDDAGNMTMYSTFSWNSEINDWDGVSHFIYEFNETGTMITFISYGWDDDTRSWEPGINNIVQSLDDYGNVFEETGGYWNGSDWIVYITNHWYWSAVVLSGIQESFIQDIKLFSQTGQIIVKGAENAEISIYNINGQLVKNIHSSSQLSYIAIEPGIYIVKAGNKYTGKIIVK